MAMNISCKFEKVSYNIFFVRAVTVKSLYTLRRRRRCNEVKSIVSTGCYPVDTITCTATLHKLATGIKLAAAHLQAPEREIGYCSGGGPIHARVPIQAHPQFF